MSESAHLACLLVKSALNRESSSPPWTLFQVFHRVGLPPVKRRESPLQLDVPIKPVAPCFVEVVGREALADMLQLPAGWADRIDHGHARLLGCATAFFHIAGRARARDILPSGFSSQTARDHMIESQILLAAAILAGEAVAQEQVEAGESRKLALLHILAQRDHRGNLHIERRRMHFAVIAFDNVDPVEEYRLDRGLPRPQAQRVIRQGCVVSIQDERRAACQIAASIFIGAFELRRLINQFSFEHVGAPS